MDISLSTALISLFSTLLGGVIAYVTARSRNKVDRRKNDEEAREAFREQLLTQIDSLNKRLSEMEERCQTQALEIIDLRNKNAKLETQMKDQFNHIAIMQCYYDHIPRPAWLKNKDGFMYYINSAYESQWGISKLKYEGNPDSFVWPDEYARIFKSNDNIVIREKKGMHFVERVPVDPSDSSKGDREWDVYKWPVIYKDDFIGIGGIATPRNKGET